MLKNIWCLGSTWNGILVKLFKARFFRHGIFQLDNTGHDLKMVNLYGNGLIGRVDVNWEEVIHDDEVGNAQIDWKRYDRRNYYIKDHLGSIRMVVDQDGQIVSAQDYYPFGETLRTYTVGSGQNDKYKFTEKERDIETGYDYFGAWFGVYPALRICVNLILLIICVNH